MKKISIISILFSMMFSLPLFAQDLFEKKDVRFGVNVESSINWLKVDNIKDINNSGAKLKAGFGLNLEFPLGKVVSFATGLNISTGGGSLDYNKSVYYRPSGDTSKFVISSRNIKTTYIDIPLTFKMRTAEIKSFTFFAQFGVNTLIRWNAKAVDKGHFPPATTEATTDPIVVNKDVSFIQLGLNIGIGAEKKLAGSTTLIVGLNYHHGFTRAINNNSKLLYNLSDGSNISQPAYARYLALTVGILF